MTRTDNVVFFDVETTKSLVSTGVYSLYRKGGYSFTPYEVDEPTRIFSFVAKPLGKRPVFAIAPHRTEQQALIVALHKVLSEADILVGWNSIDFDWRHAQREFVEAGLERIPQPYQVDLMKVSRKHFNFLSHSLAYVSGRLLPADEAKIHLDVPVETLYRAIQEGDKKAERLLRRYNTRDVTSLEALWEVMLPYVVLPHAAPAAEDIDRVCPTCGSTETIARGSYRTAQGAYPRRSCNNGHWYRLTRASSLAKARAL